MNFGLYPLNDFCSCHQGEVIFAIFLGVGRNSKLTSGALTASLLTKSKLSWKEAGRSHMFTIIRRKNRIAIGKEKTAITKLSLNLVYLLNCTLLTKLKLGRSCNHRPEHQ